MTATFGALENQTMELQPGLNVISAPNEQGKSTWCAFIRAMLYGVDSSQREKNGVKPDKVRYAPWSGSPMSGEMEIEQDGRELTLRRSTRLASAPMREFSAVYTGTAEKVEGLTGTGVGESLTGMSRTVFESSVFVRQAGLNVENSAELEKRIAAIVSTGEESIGYTDADAALRAWQRKRKYNRSGAIPALEGEIDALRRRIHELDSAADERRRLQKALDENREREAQLAQSARSDSERERDALTRRLEERRENLRRAQDERDRAKESVLRAQADVDASPLSGQTPDAASKDAQGDVDELKTLQKSLPKRAVMLACLVLGVVTAILGFALAKPLLILAAALFIADGAVCAVSLKRSKALKFYENYLRRKYGSADEDTVRAAVDTYLENTHRLDIAKNALEAAEKTAQQAQNDLRRVEENLLNHSGAVTEGDERMRRSMAEGASLERQLSELKGRFSALGDPMVLKTELSDMEEHLHQLQSQYESLNLAIATLREANDEMQQRFSPELSRRASEIMSYLTAGRYDRLVFDRQLAALSRLSGETADRETAYLSAGTADQLYLALRLAICQLALPDGNTCPIILDDALVNFDDERMGLALELLRQMAQQRQIILFTCHAREKHYLTEHGI